jgi:hypothetical protein
MTLTAHQTLRDDLAATMIDGIHAMAAQDAATLDRTIHPGAVNREAVTEPPAARGHGPRPTSPLRVGCPRLSQSWHSASKTSS